MNQPIEAFCRLGLVHFMAFPELAGAADPGKRPSEGSPWTLFSRPLRSPILKTPRFGNASGIWSSWPGCRWGTGLTPTSLRRKLNINALDEEERESACAELKRHLDEAVFLGAETFVILSGKEPGEPDREKAVESLVKSLDKLCAYSASLEGPGSCWSCLTVRWTSVVSWGRLRWPRRLPKKSKPGGTTSACWWI